MKKTEKITDADGIPCDDYGESLITCDIPLTHVRRVNWSDVDSAQVGYTSRQLDFALEAIEIWWEQVLRTPWYQLRLQGMGAPSVKAGMEFHYPVRPGERTFNKVFVTDMGRTSLEFRVEGYNAEDRHCYTGYQKAVLVSGLPDHVAPAPIPDNYRRLIEGYRRECELVESGVANRRQILDFWFGAPGNPERGQPRMMWFGGSDDYPIQQIDADIEQNFTATHEAVSRGDLDHWMESPAGALALIICLDQFSRHLYRSRPEAFANDAKALTLAKKSLDRGYDQQVGKIARHFFYLPFEHAEDPTEQERAVALFTAMSENPESDEGVKWARIHQDIIREFGRFPHRNRILGRTNTAAEEDYLASTDNSFNQ